MPDEMPLTRLITRKDNIGATRLETVQVPAMAEGEALLSLESFALTANNLTYAAFGEAKRYWEFFPTGAPDWGAMPVWGFATVRASSVPELREGERFYGYFPMADFLRVRPGRFSERGFYDMTDYRQPLPSPYNQYTRCATDPAHVAELEDHQMLLRPLFFTSYMLADFLDDSGHFGAEQLVISSASSKTAYGTAFCLKALPRAPKLIGLTSPRNRAYVTGLGLYDSVLAYDEVVEVAPAVPTLYVDFSGRVEVRGEIHRHCEQLVHDCYAGSSANFDYLVDRERFDPVPQSFFAPNQIRKRNQDWGPAVLAERFGQVQRRFLSAVADPNNGWMRIERSQGFEAAARIIHDLCETGGAADVGYTISLQGA